MKQYLMAWLELHGLGFGLVFARSAGLQSLTAGHPWQLRAVSSQRGSC